MDNEPEIDAHPEVIDTIVREGTIILAESKLSQTSPEAAKLSWLMRTDLRIFGVPNTDNLKRFLK